MLPFQAAGAWFRIFSWTVWRHVSPLHGTTGESEVLVLVMVVMVSVLFSSVFVVVFVCFLFVCLFVCRGNGENSTFYTAIVAIGKFGLLSSREMPAAMAYGPTKLYYFPSFWNF